MIIISNDAEQAIYDEVYSMLLWDLRVKSLSTSWAGPVCHTVVTLRDEPAKEPSPPLAAS